MISKYSKNKTKSFLQKKVFQRNKIKNTSFSNRTIATNNKKNYKKHQIKIFSIKSKILEKEINKSLKQYADFKSNVFLKQHKEKEIHKNDDDYQIKKLNRNLNYTNIVQLNNIIENKLNPLKNFDLKSKINELDNVNKNINKNRIGNFLSNQILHNVKIKSRVDSGLRRNNFLEISKKINNSKLNLQKKNKFMKRKANSNIRYYYSLRMNKNIRVENLKNYTNILDNKKDIIKFNQSTSIDKSINNKSYSKNSSGFKRLIRSKSDFGLNNDILHKLNVNKYISDHKIFKRRNMSSYNYRYKINEKNYTKNTSADESMNYNSHFQSQISNFPFGKKRKTNSVNSKRVNFKSNENRNKSLLHDESKFITLIEKIYEDYTKIKSNTKKLKTKYKEWGFSSPKNIDIWLNTKEDMLIFLLKQKYLKNINNFPKEKQPKLKSKSVMEKIKSDFEYYED